MPANVSHPRHPSAVKALKQKKDRTQRLRIELLVRPVEKRTVSQCLCVRKAEAQKEEGNIKWCPANRTAIAFRVPPFRHRREMAYFVGGRLITEG